MTRDIWTAPGCMYTQVEPDMENNADRWWSELRKQYPAFTALLRGDDRVWVSAQALRDLKALDGYADGPSFAREALLEQHVLESCHFDRAALEAEGCVFVDELS